MSHELLSSERQGLLGLIGSLACGALALNKPATLTTLHIDAELAAAGPFYLLHELLPAKRLERGRLGEHWVHAKPWVKLKAAAWRCSRAGRQARYE